MKPEDKEQLIKQLDVFKKKVENNEIQSMILGYVNDERYISIHTVGLSKYLTILDSEIADEVEKRVKGDRDGNY